MSVINFILIALIILLACSHPAWPYATDWGYVPFGTLLFVILLILLLR